MNNKKLSKKTRALIEKIIKVALAVLLVVGVVNYVPTGKASAEVGGDAPVTDTTGGNSDASAGDEQKSSGAAAANSDSGNSGQTGSLENSSGDTGSGNTENTTTTTTTGQSQSETTGNTNPTYTAYHLTVSYLYAADNSTAAAAYSADIGSDGNYTYSVNVPAIDGYTASVDGNTVTGSISGTLDAAKNITVYYTAVSNSKADANADTTIPENNGSSNSTLAATEALAPSTETATSGESTDPVSYNLVIKYWYEEGGKAADDYSADIVKDSSGNYSYSVTVPAITGYTAHKGDASGDVITTLAGNLTADASINVVYTVNDISYTVRHILQKLDGTYDEDNAETETLTGKYGQLTNALPRSYTGYTADDFNQVNISGEGIVVDIKYDRNIYTLTFNSNGGSYVDPIDAMYGKTVDFSSVEPTKTGYEFGGWYENADLTGDPVNSIELTANTTLYAKWDAGTATYTVVYWKQQVTDSATATDSQKKYDYAETASAKRSATVGASVSPTYTDKSMGYTHFRYNATNSVAVTVKADGTTVLNVYYDRDVMTLNFYEKIGYSSKFLQSMSGLYGAKLPNKYPTDLAYYYGNTRLTYLDAFIFPTSGTTLNLYGYTDTSTSYVHQMTENLNGSGWTEASVSKSNGDSGFSFSDKFDGFYVGGYRVNSQTATFHQTTSTGKYEGKFKDLYVYNYRYSYNFTYYNYNSELETDSVKYGASLTDKASKIPPEPEELANLGYYEFGGWFKDPSCTHEFDFSQTMPANGVTVYAKWTPRIFTVTFNSQGGSAIASQSVTGGTTAAVPTDPTYTGYTFKGWYTDAAGTTKYVFEKPVTDNITIYAKWQKNTTVNYSVHYYVDGVEQTGATTTATGTIGATVYGYASTFLKEHSEYSNYTTDGAIKSIVLVEDETANVIKINFYKSATLPYRIDYVLASDITVHLASSTTVTDNTTKHKVVSALSIPGYNYLNGTLTMDLVVEPSISHNVFTFKYEPIDYTISYNLNGGAVTSANPTTYNIRSAAITLNNPAKTGYTFLGWTGTNLSGVTERVTIPTGSMGNRSYTANWKINTFTITTSAANGTITPTATVDYGTNKTVTYSPNAGYHLVSVTVDGTDVTAANPASYAFTNVAENHTVAVVYAKNTELTVKADDLTVVYDGQKHNQPNVTPTGLLSGDILTATTSGSITDAGTAANTVTAGSVHITRNGKDVTNEYDITLLPGTLTVNPVAIELTADSAKRAYDGTALTANGYKITSGEFVGKDGLAGVTVTGSQTFVGASYNTITGHTLAEGTKAQNYSITYKKGTLEVTQASIAITITAGSGTKTYDGVALINGGYTLTAGTLATGDAIESVTVTGSQTDAGDSANTAKAAVIEHDGTDVTANYKITYANGTLTVNPVSIELKAGSASKEYDGTALTNDSYEVTSGAFVGNDGLDTVTVTGSRTLVGTSDNLITAYTLKTGTIAGNYKITTVKGSLSVTNENPIAITITANTASKTYDGDALTDGGYKLTAGSLATGDSMTGGTMTGTIIDAGTVTNSISGVKIMHDKDDVTANYKITYEDGTLTVNPITIKITAASDSKEYDGKPLTNSNYTTEGTFAGDEGFASVTVTGSQTLPGTSTNAIAYALKDNTKAGNYDIKPIDGSLTVNKASIKVSLKADTASKTYDSTALTAGYTKEGDLATGDVLQVTVTGSQTDAGTSKNIITKYSVMHDSTDVTDNYAITTTDGTLTVNPVAIELTADSAKRAYDGTALTANGYKITTGAFVGNDGLASVTVEGSRTLVGSSANTITAHTLKAGTKASNYAITYAAGILEVTKASIAITVTAESGSKTYDGNALTNNTYTKTGILATGDALTVIISGSQTDAGTSDNKVTSVVVKHGDDVVTDNYVITTADGKLTVNPVAIELTADSAKRAYDGTALTANGYKITSGEFVTGEGLASVTVSGTQTFVGSSDNTITGHTLTVGTKAQNYSITYKKGTLEVTQASIAITITAGSGTKTYDGVALINGGYTLTAGTLATGDAIESVTVTGSQTDAGDSANTAKAAVIEHDGTDVTANYKITYANGTLTVNPVSIELKAGSASKEYDGTALTNDSYEVTSGAFVGNDGLDTVTVTGSRTLVGTSDNLITAYTLKTGTIAGNYKITTVKGSLSVTNENPIAITITANTASKTYDGDALTDGGYKLTAGSLATGDSMTGGTMTGTIIDAGTVTNSISGVKIMHDKDDVTANYKITYEDGTLTVNPITIKITAASDSKEYDGKPLTNSNYTTEGTFAGDEGFASVTVTGSQTLPGTSTNAIAYALKDNTKAGNYDIKPIDGSLTVNKASIKVSLKADTASKTYDSTALTAGYTKEGDLATGDVLQVTVTGSQTDAGTSKNIITKYSVMHDSTDVTDNYAITTTDGTLTVNPVAIELTADSAKRAYDGTALTANGYKITTGAFVGNDGLASVTVEGSRTLVGSSANTITAHTLKAGTKASNYAITYAAGILEVTKASIAITVTAESGSKTYDGNALTNNTYTKTGILATGDALTVIISGSQTDAGTSDNKVTSVVVKHGDDVVTDNYVITTADGKLTVNPVAIELTADSAKRAYDGTALTANGYKITSGEFVTGEGLASVTVSGTQTFVGSSDNTITGHTLTVGTKAQNYSITYKKGTLEVTQASIAITITAGSGTKTYDGVALINGGYTLTAGTLATGDAIESVTVTGSQTDAGDSANTAKAAVIEHDGTDVTANYKITYANGTLTVNPVSIELKAGSASKEYDGTALTNDSYEVTSGAFVGNDGLDTVTVTGSRTLVGTSDNLITAYTLKTGTIAGNYKITTVKGSLSVTNENPIAITITANTASKTYDGDALTDGGYKLTAGSLATGDSMTGGTMTGTIIDAGTVTNSISGVKIMHDKDDVTANYKITYLAGNLTVNPVAIVLTANSASKAYDGTALTDSGYKITTGAFVGNDGLAGVTVSGSQTFAGSSDNTITGHTLAEGTKAQNYSITYKKGTLEVTQASIAITITADSGTKTYDGTALTKNTYTSTGTLAAGDTISSVTLTGSQTDAGDSANTAKAAVIKHDGTDVTANYKITYADGTLTVNPVAIVLTADSASKAYDGTALTANGYKITTGAFVGNDGLASVTVAGSQLFVGSSANKITKHTLSSGTVAGNYSITYADGTLEVTQASIAITITADSGTKTYDGTALTKNTYTSTGTLAAGDTISSVILTGSQTDAGNSANTAKAAVIKHDGTDVSANYKITYMNGKLTVDPRAIELTADSAKKVYDGKALTKNSYQITSGEFVTGEGLASVTVEGTRTFVGNSENKITAYALKDGTKAGNYTITTKTGTLEITKASIALQLVGADQNWDYDGAEHNSPTYQITGDLAANDSASASMLAVIKNAGTVTNKLTDVKVLHDNGDGTKTEVTENYELTVTDGTLTINKLPVTIAANSATKMFDGKPLFESGYAITSVGEGNKYNTTLLGKLTLDAVTVTGSQTAVGSSDNVPSDAVFSNDGVQDDINNYDVTYVNGTLTITAVPPVPTPTPGGRSCQDDGYPAGYYWNGTACVIDNPTPVPTNIPNAPTPTPGNGGNTTVVTTPTPEAVTVSPAPNGNTTQPTYGRENGSWALLNLIMTIITMLLAIFELFAKKEKEEDPDENDENIRYDEDGNVIPNTYKRSGWYKVALAVFAILQIILFILTENMRLPMVIWDKWTLVNIIATIATVVIYAFARKWKKQDEDDDETAEQTH